jgi:predicted lipoprotein with Yx(FWY)xxD motif
MLAKAGAQAAGDYSLIVREDGKQQWAYKGRPLYLWANDKKPGDRSVDGFRGGVWHLAKP